MPDRPENRKIDDDVRILNEKLQECELHLLVQVNERKQAEESMLKNEQKIRALFNETFQFVGLLTPDGVLVEVNRAALEFSGFEIDSVLNKPFWQGPWWAHSPELQEKLRQSVEKVARGEFVRFEATHVAKDGSLHYIDFSLKPVWDGVGNVVYMIPEGRDVTEHKMAEEERNKLLFWQQGINLLHQSLLMPAPLEDKLKLITDSIVRLFDVDFARIWLIRPGDLCEKGCTHTKNTNGAHVCNYHEKCLHLLSSSGRYTSIDGKIHRRVPFGCYKIGLIASGQEHKFVTNDVSNDPQVHNHEWARELGLVSFAGYQLKVLKGDILGVLALFAKHAISESEDILLDALSNTTAFIVQQGMAQRDLRESYLKLKDTQAQLMQAEKFSAIGVLASGVAHEVRNPLGIMIQGVNYLETKIGVKDSDVLDILNILKDSIKRADKIISGLLDFSKITALDLQRQDVNPILEHSLNLVKSKFEFQQIEIIKELNADIPEAWIDKNRIEQVFVNILLNAAQAMPGGGRINIRSYVKQMEEARTPAGKGLDYRFRGGEKVLVIEFEDTGMGIPEENITNIFNPFFTTKGPKGGTGLGLSVSLSIVRMHKGLIYAQSQVGKGTKMTIILKIAEGDL